MNAKVYKEKNLQIIFSITLITVLGVSSIAPILPSIREHFNISLQQSALLITAFTLPGIFITPLMGVIADRTGRKRVLLIALFVFGISGTLCALTSDFYSLLFFRLLQGIGAAPLSSLNVALITEIYVGQRRSEALGYNATVLSIGTTSFPLIGGLLASIKWQYPFFLAAFSLLIGAIAWKHLTISENIIKTSLRDYIKATGKSLINKKVISILCISLISFIMLYGCIISYMPFKLHNMFGLSSASIGLSISALSIGTAIAASQNGRLHLRFTSEKIMLFAFVFYCTSFLLIPFASYFIIIIGIIMLNGIGQGLNMPNLYEILSHNIPNEQRAAVLSVNGMVFQLGQTLGPLLMGWIYLINQDMNHVFFAGSFLAMIALILIWLNLNRRSGRN